MRKIVYSVVLAILLVTVLALSVYSQQPLDPASMPAIRLLQGGVRHQVPLEVTLVVPTDAGAQTVTVPLVLNLDLSVGPLEAIDLNVQAEQPLQFASPLQILDLQPITASVAPTASGVITDGAP